MTPFFISRIFEEHAAAKRSIPSAAAVPGQMGFQSFVDFWLAWDHRSAPFGVRYFFPVLDFHHSGKLTQVRCSPLLFCSLLSPRSLKRTLQYTALT